MNKTYTELEIKEIYANLIEQIGADGGSVCNWSGIDTVSLDGWKKAWWTALQSYADYERNQGRYLERQRIASELLEYEKNNK